MSETFTAVNGHDPPARQQVDPVVATATLALQAGLLAGRTAKCSCGATCASDSPRAAFVEYHGPRSRYAAVTCKHCRFHDVAHEPAHMAKLVPGRDGKRRPTVVEDGTCPGFESIGPVEFDSYYCGCRGWD